MGNRVATWIRIGGALKRSLLPALIHLVNQEELQKDWGTRLGKIAGEEDLLLSTRSDGSLFLCHEEQRDGQFADLEEFLIHHGLPFDRDSDPQVEFPGELVRFRPGMTEPLFADSYGNGRPMVQLAEIQNVRDLLSRDSSPDGLEQALRQLNEICAPADLEPVPPFEVVD